MSCKQSKHVTRSKQLGDTQPRQTLAKGDKLTVTLERIDGGKLRCTGATWSDAVVVLPDQVLTPSLTVTVERIDGGKPRRDLGRCRSGPSRQGGRHPPISVPSRPGEIDVGGLGAVLTPRSRSPPDKGVGTPRSR